MPKKPKPPPCDPVTKQHTSCVDCEAREDSLMCSSPEGLAVIEKVKVVTKLKAGQYIFYAGNDPLGIFTLQKGLVKLEVTSESGVAHTLRMVGPGGALGYRSLFADEPYHASAVAVEDVVLCFIPKHDILSLFKTHPDIMVKLLSHVSKDLRQAEKKWMDQMDKGASERVAEALLFLQENFANQNWTRREIAQWAGTTPETVIRTLAQFEKENLIHQKEGRHIEIINRDELKVRAHH